MTVCFMMIICWFCIMTENFRPKYVLFQGNRFEYASLWIYQSFVSSFSHRYENSRSAVSFSFLNLHYLRHNDAKLSLFSQRVSRKTFWPSLGVNPLKLQNYPHAVHIVCGHTKNFDPVAFNSTGLSMITFLAKVYVFGRLESLHVSNIAVFSVHFFY